MPYKDNDKRNARRREKRKERREKMASERNLFNEIKEGFDSLIENRERIIHTDARLTPDLDISTLLRQRKDCIKRKRDYEEYRKLIHLDVTTSKPIGILLLGDPHVDDDGCDWEALDSHIDLINRTPGMFAATVGDMQNNWVGRIAHLYGAQSTSARESWMLVEYLINSLRDKWLFLVGGNHDAWSGDGDPLNWITEQAGAIFEQSEVRIQLAFSNGKSVKINARHDFSGNSQWNPVHGPVKAAHLGVRDDIIVCGHKHKSGYAPIKDPESGRICHCLQVASYKTYDRYAREKGFRDQSIGPCAVAIIDPTAKEPSNLIQIIWEPNRAADYLRFLRSGD